MFNTHERWTSQWTTIAALEEDLDPVSTSGGAQPPVTSLPRLTISSSGFQTLHECGVHTCKQTHTVCLFIL